MHWPLDSENHREGFQICAVNAAPLSFFGLAIQRHDEVCDTIGDLASLVWNQVKREPIVRETDSEIGVPALVADLAVCGVSSPQTEVLFNIRVINTDGWSYSNQSPKDMLRSAEN